MPPPWATNPAPKTESAREARKSFYCDLCQKGYSRINEFEAHEGSYDHQHKKRLKEMKAMTKDPQAASKARRAEQREASSAGITIKPISLSGSSKAGGAGGGFKKGGFRNAFAAVDDDGSKEEPPSDKGDKEMGGAAGGGMQGAVKAGGLSREEGEEDGDWGDYDPRRPTGCGAGCPGWG